VCVLSLVWGVEACRYVGVWVGGLDERMARVCVTFELRLGCVVGSAVGVVDRKWAVHIHRKRRESLSGRGGFLYDL
jgi:hypothetical protein